jgi:hypothetical protein
MLMHASLTACTLILTSQVTEAAFLTYSLASIVAAWVFVAAVAAANRWHLSRQPPLPRRWVA